MRLTDRQIELVQQCSTAEELVSKAEGEGLALTIEQARDCLGAFEFTELSEDDCEVAAGGCDSAPKHTCAGCGTNSNELRNALWFLRDGLEYCEDCAKTLFPEWYELLESE